ncbi:MAG: type II toxin-antitoxin system VapC family toxin [Dehalococcoidia bacterium]
MTRPFAYLATNRAFIDSSAYLALLDRTDQWRQQATLILRPLVANRSRQFTTNRILTEAHALILANLGIARSAQFLSDLRAGNTVIVRATTRDEQRAEAIIFQHADKRFSLTDAISFAVMECLHITRAFTFDRNFEEYRFIRLRP